MGITDSFVPVANIITAFTNATVSQVTTNTPHGYVNGQVVRIIVPPAYGMNLFYIQTIITIVDTMNFLTTIDTTRQRPFIIPTFPPGFTPAQVTPISGVEMNIAV
ncbi:MAG: hypothetical protein WAN50_02770 [Minisyncoccia bacterium]